MSYLDIFSQAVLQNADKPAIVDNNGQRTINYIQLDDISGKIASKLKSLGCQRGEAVIIRLGRQAEFIAAEIGAMKLGCIAVPTLPSYPQERVDYIASDCGAKIIIDDAFISDIDSYKKAEPVKLNDNDRVWIIYTSGSTGKPKGIVYSARVFEAAVKRTQTRMSLVKPIRFGAAASLSFVVTIDEYFAVLSLGGCSHILSDEVRMNIGNIQDYYAQNQITIGFLSPRILRIYKNKDKSLQVVFTGSERVTDSYSDEYVICNCYGQSETTGCVLNLDIDKKYDNTPIGKPREGVKVYLIDNDGKEVADGEEGEICVQGIFTSEYMNLPEQSAKTFKKLPNGEVLVHTGDIGRRLSNGNILYVNRKDWMVKINGQRVEPGEIEAVIKAIPKVTNVAVKDFVNASGQVYLCGYYTSDEDISDKFIRQELESKLPDYMIPAYLVKLDAMPTNMNGKLDRHALVPPSLTDNKSEYVAPTNDTEEKLCAAFEKVLKCGKVGINDDFFMLGGDSVKVMQLQNECGISGLSTSAIFEGKTPLKISAMLKQCGKDIFAECIAEKREIYPLTASQMGVYLACVQNPTGTMYNTPSCYTFSKTSEIDIEKLISAVKKTVNNHISLRVTIDNSTGNPMMRLRDISINIPIIKTTDSELNSAKKDFIKPFDLEKDILCRFTIFETESVYCLAMDFHHLVFDGTSGAVILRDISLAYDGKELPKEQLTQLNLAVYEEKLENMELYSEAKKFYDNIFSGLEMKSEITADYKEDSNVENKPGAEFTVFVNDKLSNANVEEYAHRIGVTANTVFLGAYEYTVSKFTGQSETVICTVNHGRHDSRMQNTVGMMVRTIPLYANINEESTISDFLIDTQNKLQNSIKHDIYPFVKLSTEYDISSDIMLAYQSDAFNSFKLGGITLKMENIPVNSALSKLNIMIFKANGGFEIRFEYRSDLYKEETIRSFADSYIKILEEFLTKDKLCELELLNSTQLSELDEFNKTEKPYDTSKTIIDLFEEQAKKLSEHTAVVYKDKKFTYEQLDELTDRLAGYVHEKGIGTEDVVSILIPRCEYMPIASLGVLKSGAAYQPLDPSYPPERLDFMIKDSSAKLLIADESLLGLLSEYKGDVLLTKDIPKLTKSTTEISRPKPDDLFILIYTSGSTGIPKGAMLEHKNVRAFCAYHTSNFDIDETSIVSAYASYGFDACLLEMYSALSTGAELHIIEEDIRLDLVKLNRYYEENGVTHAFMTTQVARQFAAEIENKSLKYLFTGGERLVPLEPPKNFVLENAYGPTECTVYITIQSVDKLYDRIPIGKALDNIKLYVIDKYGRRLPIGALGELCASGRQVSRGYLNRPEQTQKMYENNPYCNEEGYERMYHTGDIVRFMTDGGVDFIGRNDGQVKIRGFRIELSEVEEIIRKYDGITDATVIARSLPTGGKCINAYIVSDKKININELNEFIESKKPPYMVPAATMQIDKIPLNVNGKVDKRKLPEIKASQDSEKDSSSQSRPMTLLEKKIFDIVARVIGHSEFNISENLMHVGMSSLSVIKLAVELNKEFGFEAKVKQMMKGCSVLSIENELQEYLMSGAMLKQNQPQQKKKLYKALYPLSKTQLGVYLDCMKNPYSTLYNIPSILTFPKTVNAEKLADSVKAVVLAHPYILTHLTTQNDDVEQVYVENPMIEIPVARFSEEKLEVFKKEFVKPHNLTKSPLFRIGVVETEKNVYLMLDFHHLIFDGASLNIFMNQLKKVYEGNQIEAEDYTYFDYVDDEINAENGEEYNNAERFFENMLKNFESSSEITPDLRGQIESGRLAEAAIPFDIISVENFCSENSITPAQLFLASSFYAVSRFVNSRNVYLSTISNGRSDMRLTNCFGMFVKTLPLGIEIEDISALEFVEKSKSVFTGSIENEIYPYAKICSKFGFAPNIVYEYQLGVTDDLIIDGSVINKDYLEMDTAKFKVAIHIESRNDKPCVVVQYNDALYSKSLMQTLAKSVLNTTKHIIEKPQEKIRKISMLDDEQLKELESFSSTLISPVETKLLHKKFEKQAEKTPDRNAIVACDRILTYSELNHLANITANELIAKGLKKGGRVVVLLKRTSKIFTTILAILKAGGAFIPTCPDYPKERIESIIEDSGADFVVTEGELLCVYDKTVDVNALLAGENSETPKVDVKPEDLAYLIYTSGSTGKPKGVMLRHIGIASYVTYSDANIQVKYVVDNCKAYGSVTTVSFDMSLKETMVSLCNGLTLVFASDEQTVNPIFLAKLLKENNVDVFNATPSRLLQYMELDEFVEVMANCKMILSGGEKYPDKLLTLLREKTNAKIINTYGPTEITVSSNAKDLTNADEITIGKPLMNYIEHIVDSDENKLPIGVVGELLISGCGVALGYNKLSEQTEKAFIEFEGERTYRSGDYAKWTPNGEVIILGRTDNQVKLRGLRIELSEIEKCLSEIEGIRSATILIRKVNKADVICAYYVADRILDIDLIKDELKKSLTDYMIPSAYIQLTEMPLTPNGKINTKLLPEPKSTEKESGLEPSTKHERILCDIFAKVLELDKVYADDNFFDIGGSSLTVTRVIILANKSGIEISYGDVFANPTPISLAKLFDKGTEKDNFEDLSSFDYSNIDKLLANNTLESFKKGDMQEIGDVLLTGAAGFLGIHILYELLHKYNGKVYCLLRDKNNNPAENRLNAIFYYYFEESLKEKYPERIIILNGDVTNRESFNKFLEFNIDTVINCAANVKHFSKGTDIEDVNLYGTLNVIDFCKQADARLIHVSTMSVGGMFVGKQGSVNHLEETQLYFGQQQGSKYTLSKFLAERAILDEASKGFNAKIMRVGTLAARNSDGEYQINFTTNTFMGRLKSNLIIGKYPYDIIEMPFELSPIDFVAKAILLLAQTPKACTVFHPFNNHMLMMGDLYMEMDRIGLHSEASEYEEYEKAFEQAKQDPEKAKILSSMLAYQNMAHGQKTFTVEKSNVYTMQVLYRMGFRWPVTSLDYMKRFINALRGLGFFDESDSDI